MTWPQSIILVILGLAILGVTLVLTRKHRLREGYAVLWVGVAVLALIFVMIPGAFSAMALGLGIDASVLMVLAAMVFLVAMALHFSVVVTRHADCEKRLQQEVAFLKDEIEKLRTEMREAPPPPAEPKPRPPALRT